MMELLKLFTQIALRRRGPQDLPASPWLLAGTVAAFVLVNSLISLVMPPVEEWLVQLFIEVAFTLVWYAVVMRLCRKPERFLQTVTAVFGYLIVLTPPLIVLTWLVEQFSKDSFWLRPLLMIMIALLIWQVAVGAHVVRTALEWTAAASVALIILQILLGQLLLFALFGVPVPTPS